jgi:Tol biopolymer transport system component
MSRSILATVWLVVASVASSACGPATRSRSVGIATAAPSLQPSSRPPSSTVPTASIGPATDLATNGKIAFNRHDISTDTGAAFTIADDGSDERRIGTAKDVNCGGWSPNGNRVACTAWLGKGARPATADSNGSDFRILDAYPNDKRSMGCGSWLSDGTTLLCGTAEGTPAADRGLYLVRASDGKDLRRVTVTPAGCGDTNVVGSPDSAEVLFARICGSEEHGVLFRVRTDGSDLVQLSPSSASVADQLGGLSADWSPDGSMVVFCAQHMPNPENEPYSMFMVNRDGTNLRQVVSTDIGAVTARWSPDGLWIALTSKLRSEPQVWIVHPDGSGFVKLTDGNDRSVSLAPIWSPDATKLLFAKATDDRIYLSTMAADGSGESHLAELPNEESIEYSWGPGSSR